LRLTALKSKKRDKAAPPHFQVAGIIEAMEAIQSM
jgi:hypothetical protein